MATGNWRQIGYSELSDSQDNITVEWTGHYENIKFSYRAIQSGTNGIDFQGKAGSNWKTSSGDYYYYYQAAADGSNAEYGRGSTMKFWGNYGNTSDLNQVNGDILNVTGERRIATAQVTSFQEDSSTEIQDSRWYSWMNNTADDLLGLRVIKESGKNDFTAGSSLTVWVHDDGTTTDFSKDSITNVPAGTRYEETDTRKIFRRKGAAVSVAGLKAYFPMNEASGDVINKASAYGSTDAISNFDLTVTGGTQNTSGKIDKCVSFTGNNKAQADDSNLTDTNFISQTGAIWTICFWVKMDNRVGDQTFISTTDFGVGEDGFWIRMANSSGGINCICGAQGSSGRVNATSSSAVIPDTNWNFVMVQYSDTTGDLKMSVNDGTVETVATGQDITNTGTPAQKLILGNSPLLDNDMNGDMEALSIWNRVLTASEITTLYGNTTDVGQGLAASWKEKGTA